MCNPEYGIGAFRKPTQGSFGWKWQGCVCKVAALHKDPFEVFGTRILRLEKNHSEAIGRTLFAGDFNSKSSEWKEARLDRRGILIGEMVDRSDLTVL